MKIGALLAFAAVLTACTDDQDPVTAESFLARIQADDYATTYARPAGWESRRPTEAPHNDAVEIFVNDVVNDVLTAGEARDAWPVGAIIVKNGYDDDGTLATIAAMEKRDDGWFWAEWNADGTSLFSGKPDLCIGCHTEGGSDLVRAFALPK